MLPDDEFEREHPSYGILHISRTSGGTSAIRLFGSPLATHYGTIRLSISKGAWLVTTLECGKFFDGVSGCG